MTAAALLSRKSHRPPPGLPLLDGVSLPLSRVHEICGRARRTLAVRIAAKLLDEVKTGPIFWITPKWERNRLNTDGLVSLLPPQSLIYLDPLRAEDILWSMEEILRSGAAPMVVADLPDPPGMTQVRRLHLAAETGTGEGRFRPLGLMLTPGTGGAPGVETRWQMEPEHTPGRVRWRLDRVRARMAPPKSWQLGGDHLF
ncbi:MAG: ImuA family protein [Pelagimonas sp.]|uniref:ImuA family protein n=1 Tax=Pelagimonas sp. TaxID=2073170 RepID=UPI003D6AD813